MRNIKKNGTKGVWKKFFIVDCDLREDECDEVILVKPIEDIKSDCKKLFI